MSQWGFPASRHSICLLLLLWTLPIAVAAQNSSSVNSDFVEAFNYAQSTNSITLRDWISLLTLCFAPVIAHFVAGTPKPVYLTYKPVRWHDRICIYNPTTILWRYFAITDRRLRHKSWNAADMAASNAYFRTAQGWNGSESMMRDSRAFLTKTPTHHRTAFFSSESIKTLIVSLQGVQALASLIGGFLAEQLGIGNSVFCATLAIDTIFFPFAIFGLLRLFAAFWLTEDYSYADRLDGLDALTIITSHTESETEQAITHTMDRKSTSTLMTMGLLEYSPHETVFDPPTNWSAIALRVTYLLPITGLLLICILFSTPGLSNFTIYPYLAHRISSSSSTHFQNLLNTTS